MRPSVPSNGADGAVIRFWPLGRLLVGTKRTTVGAMDDRAAVDALVSDLHWQIDQLKPRGIKNNVGHPYNPSYYKRGLQNAVDRGGLAVAEYLRGYLTKPPSD